LAASRQRNRLTDGRAICSSAITRALHGNLVSSTICRHAVSGFSRDMLTPSITWGLRRAMAAMGRLKRQNYKCGDNRIHFTGYR
jgi:hypothetical protein